MKHFAILVTCLSLAACGGGDDTGETTGAPKGSGGGGGSSELASLLSNTPPSMMILYADAKSMKEMGTLMGKSPADDINEYGIDEKQIKKMISGIDMMKMFSGEGGMFILFTGTFQQAEVEGKLEKQGWKKGEAMSGFSVHTKTKDDGSKMEMMLAVKDGTLITGTEPDVKAGLQLQDGEGTSALKGKGVQDVLGHLGSPDMAVLMSMPDDGKNMDNKDFKLNTMSMAFSGISADGKADVTMVASCPDEENAKKALADFQKQYEEKKDKTPDLELISIKREGRLMLMKARGPLKEFTGQK